jgi:hypothetical protein
MIAHQSKEMKIKKAQILSLIFLGFACLGAIRAAVALPQDPHSQNPPAVRDAAKPSQNGQSTAAGSLRAAKSTLYVYRPRRYEWATLKPSVYADGKQLARIENGRFFVVKLDAGKHTIRSDDKAPTVDIDMDPGRTYYLCIEIEEGLLKGYGSPSLVPADQGQNEVKQTTPLSARDIKDRALVVTETNQ